MTTTAQRVPQEITDVSVLEDLGFAVTRTESNLAPFMLKGKRGACYGLMRNQENPDLLFVYGSHARVTVRGYTWFRVVDGKVTAVR